MFTLDQISQTQSKVRSGADFPRYIRELKSLGLVRYEHRVADGSNRYQNGSGAFLESPANYDVLTVATTGNATLLENALRIHQQGGTDYPTFCREAAAAGVEKWTVDIARMVCSYYDSDGNLLLEEAIPQA